MSLINIIFLLSTILLLCLILYLFISKKILYSTEKVLDISIMAYVTFFSVYLGILFGNRNTSEREKEQLVKLLRSVNADIETSKEDILHTWYKRNTFETSGEKSAFVRNAYTEPISLSIILQKDFVIQNMNPMTWNLLLLRDKDISKTLISEIKDKADYDFTHSTLLRLSYELMGNTQKIIEKEILFQEDSSFPIDEEIGSLDEEKRSKGRIIMDINKFKIETYYRYFL